MRKRVFLAWLLVVAMAVATGCSLIVKDAEVDKQTVIIDVAGKTYTKGEITPMVQNTLDYQEYMYSMYYGQRFDKTSSEAVSSAQDSVISSLIQEAVLESKQAEKGMNVFTDEELATMKTTAESTRQNYIDAVKKSDFAETQLTGEELDKAVEDKMAEYGYPTLDELVEQAKTTAATDKLKAEVVKDVTVSEDELQTEYNTHVENAKTEYAATPATYGTAVTSGTTVYYVPAGYRYVKHILLKFADEDNTKISDLNSQISDKQTQLTNVEASLTDLGEDEGKDDEQTAQNRKELTDTQTTLKTEIADLQSQLDQVKEAAYAVLEPKAAEIEEKLALEGSDFDALMAEYGQDPGMQSEPAKTNGYPVCATSTNWVAEFRDGAMALAKIGDVSQPVRTSMGLHIIKYVGDATEGPVAYEDVKDTLQSEMLTSKQDELYNTTVEQWVSEANAKIYKDRLAD